MKLVYIAGPYRAGTVDGIRQNIERARNVAHAVVTLPDLGYYPVTPHLLTAFFDGAAPDTFFLDGTMELLRRCDAVLLVSGWQKSTGTALEIAEAKRLGMPVFQSVYELASHADVERMLDTCKKT